MLTKGILKGLRKGMILKSVASYKSVAPLEVLALGGTLFTRASITRGDEMYFSINGLVYL